MDWAALGDETIDLLRRYLMIDTTNPPGNEIAGTRFLAEVLAREGIASETIEAAPGRASLQARLAGDGSLGGIVLHHHIDVVYADRRYWTVDPFGGVIAAGYLYGRGAIDMKSTGILHLAAMLALKRAGIPLKRDLVFLATADEEAGSEFGARFIADHHRDWLAGAEYAISELGAIQRHSGLTGPLASIVISEKTGLPLVLTARSEPGHGSMPWPDTAPNRLVRALNRLLEAERPFRVLPEVQEFFSRVAGLLPGDSGVGYDDLERSLRDPAFRARFVENRQFAAMVRTTFAVTMLQGSEKSNVIPPEATAQLDCRMLAGDDPEEIAAWVRRAIADEHVGGGGADDPGRVHRQLGVPQLRAPRLRLQPVRHRRGGAAAHPRQRRASVAGEPPRGCARLHRDADRLRGRLRACAPQAVAGLGPRRPRRG